MNRIEKVLTQVGFTIQNLECIVQSCPGTYIDGMPKYDDHGGEDNDYQCRWCKSCTECWESEGE